VDGSQGPMYVLIIVIIVVVIVVIVIDAVAGLDNSSSRPYVSTILSSDCYECCCNCFGSSVVATVMIMMLC
jgi:ABC-type sulfate transport system permease component